MNELGAETESLSQLFDKGLNIHNDVINSSEETNSHTFQDKVKKGILILEDATRLVSILDIFSRNENYSELPTEHVKFFLLPVLLGIYLSGFKGDSNFVTTIRGRERYNLCNRS